MRAALATIVWLAASASAAVSQASDGRLPIDVGVRLGGTPVGTTQGLFVGLTGEWQPSPFTASRVELGWVDVGRDFGRFGDDGRLVDTRRVRTRGVVALLSGGPRLPLGAAGVALVPALGVGIAQLRASPLDTLATRPGEIAGALTLTLLGEGQWRVDYGWYLFGGLRRNDVRPTLLRLGWRW
jgi:hypothetical protein